MTSLSDRPITATSDDSVCHWHAAKLWQTRAKLLKLNLICVISCTTSKKLTKIWTIDLKNIQTLKTCVQLERGQLGSYWLLERGQLGSYWLELAFSWKEDSSVPIGWSLRFLRELHLLHFLRCVGWKPRSY